MLVNGKEVKYIKVWIPQPHKEFRAILFENPNVAARFAEYCKGNIPWGERTFIEYPSRVEVEDERIKQL